MVKPYSKKRDGAKKLSQNFTVIEFACKDGSDEILIDTRLVEILQKIRNHFGKPITLTSAYRNPVYNKKIGGVSNSQHTKGTAVDMCIDGVKPKEVAKYAEYLIPNSGGIGLYSNFTHIDVRSNRSRWENYGYEKVVSGFPGYIDGNKIEVKNATEAITALNKIGIINTPTIWNNGTWDDNEFKILLCKIATYIKKINITKPADAIAYLNKVGIINTPEIWYNGTWKDEHFKALLIKCSNYILKTNN